MGLRGRMSWIAGDVLDEVRDLIEEGRTVSEALRFRMGLPDREPENRINLERRGDKRYDVLHLDVGDKMSFKDVSSESLSKSIKRQLRGTGREFKLSVTSDDIQVIRIK